MKIKAVERNNRRRVFEVSTRGGAYVFPYAKLEVRPSAKNRIRDLHVDQELGREAFTYVLESGDEGTVHIDQVLEYNQDPDYLTELLLYELTLEAQRRVESSAISKREISRMLGTSAAQLYRLLDQTNYRKSVQQMLRLLYLLDCEVELVVRERRA